MIQETQQEKPIDTGKLIHMLSHQLKRHNSASEESSDLTHIQRHILNYILFESLGRDVYQKDLEEAFHIRKSTVTGILQLMEKNGFIKRESVEKDARLKRIVPTPKAEKRREKIMENIRATERRLEMGISKEDLETCRFVLERMLQNLSENEEPKNKSEQGGFH
ncbi:MarR family winged helix-turn-helix transcriptional regulator [Solibaculum mannosilyticum]|uniref:MarR family winged helix-turn-helix transcriptional regulator n=1 Tax=Solibaculum mannosilyticum TaxID=2780922 RepID=UPI0007A9082E|nr:transcriptional regulator SlyA [Eubacteriaceae bacterium CHKCI005]